MRIKIVQRPIGEAPDWVRDAWIGLSLPLKLNRQHRWWGLGVLTGPDRGLSQLWALITGKSITVAGYLVNAKAAVDCLANHHPEASAWWREHTPGLLSGKRYFVFDTSACERES